MNERCPNGFTLVEMLVALALTAIVATAALTALNTFVDADQRASQRMEQTVGVGRALQQLRRDVGEATAVGVNGNVWVVTRRDGTAVGYAIAVGGTELHRFEAATPVAASTLVLAAAAAATPAATYSARGHLADSNYRAEAVLQGVRGITATPVTRSSSTLGVQVAVHHGDGLTTQCLAMSATMLETYSKSAAVTGGSGSGSGSGSDSDSGLGDVLDGVTGGLDDLLKGNLLGGSSRSRAK